MNLLLTWENIDIFGELIKEMFRRKYSSKGLICSVKDVPLWQYPAFLSWAQWCPVKMVLGPLWMHKERVMHLGRILCPLIAPTRSSLSRLFGTIRRCEKATLPSVAWIPAVSGRKQERLL